MVEKQARAVSGGEGRRDWKSGFRKLALVMIIVAALGGVAWLGGSCIYKKGQEAGASEQKATAEEDLKALGRVVEEKAGLLEKLDALNRGVPEEIDSETIESYLEKLKEVVNSCEDTEVKALLEEYQSAWEKLGEVYATKDSEKIEEELEAVGSTAEEVAEKITEVYNSRIKEAAGKLGE